MPLEKNQKRKLRKISKKKQTLEKRVKKKQV